MKWHAIIDQQGTALAVCPAHRGAWSMALGIVETTSPLYREWYKHDIHAECVAAVEALGYRCTEVEVIPTGKMDVIRSAIDLMGLDMDRLEEWRNNQLPAPGHPSDPQSLGYRLECDGRPPWTCVPRELNTDVMIETTVIGSPWRNWRDPLTGEIHDGRVYYERLRGRMGR